MRGDVTKLPKWAQAEIRRLEANVRYLTEKLEVGPEDSDTFADPYGDSLRPLGRGTTIRFRVGPEDVWGNVVDVQNCGDHVRVSGGHGLVVRPWASNVIHVKPNADR